MVGKETLDRDFIQVGSALEVAAPFGNAVEGRSRYHRCESPLIAVCDGSDTGIRH